MHEHIKHNLALWNAWTPLHINSKFYDVEAFRRGQTSLREIELSELTPKPGQSLLHLQCHFGLDSLSWARMGARVTAVDLSDVAIDAARNLARETGLDARFICCDLHQLPAQLNERFEIVFCSYGVLNWHPDIDAWADVVARMLQPGGVFYMVEIHPLARSIGDNGELLQYGYFHEPQAEIELLNGSYAAPDADVQCTSHEWAHGQGEIISALAKRGLRIEFVHEFPFVPYDCLPGLEEREAGRFYYAGTPHDAPLTISIRARAAGSGVQ